MIEIISPGRAFSPLARCIYCNSNDDDLRREHIIPFGLGGQVVLPRSSCRKCEVITGRIEQIALRGMLGRLRLRLGLPSRRKKVRPNTLPITFVGPDGTSSSHHIRVEEYPQYLVTFLMLPPGILMKRAPEETITVEPRLIVTRKGDEGPANWRTSVRIQPWAYLRMLTKIAHSYAVAELGWEAFHQFAPLLPDVILEKSNLVSHVIGRVGDSDGSGAELHALCCYSIVLNGMEYLVVDVALFAMMKAPIFRVVVGERPALSGLTDAPTQPSP